MRRILPAAVLAMLFHAVVLSVDIGWLKENRMTMPKSTAVMITMSYRQPAPVSEIKKKPVKQQKVKPVKPAKVPEKPKPLSSEKVIKIPQEPEPDLAVEKDEIAASDESGKSFLEEKILLKDIKDSAGSNMQVDPETVPLYKRNPPPGYPRIARNRGWQGTVVLNVLVDENGQVTNVWVFKSSRYRVLDHAAVTAVRDWIFEPGTRGGKKAKMWIKVPIRFQLN